MAGFQSPITINEAMQKIRNNEYLIPEFTREYLYQPFDVEIFFNSIMRDYPIHSMIFWRVKDESKTSYKFYEFLSYCREFYYYTSCRKHFKTRGYKDFYAILDGHHRLTYFYLALFGSYDISIRRLKEYYFSKRRIRIRKAGYDDPRFKMCHLYLNLTQIKEPRYNSEYVAQSQFRYEFLWLDKDETEEKTIFIDKDSQKWFKCGDFYKYETSRVKK